MRNKLAGACIGCEMRAELTTAVSRRWQREEESEDRVLPQ